MKALKEMYGDQLRLVFKHQPLGFHKYAHLAAQASLAAQAQGRFWEYHDKLFANSQNLTREDLLRYAREIGLDMARFSRELDDQVYKAAVDQDAAEGMRIGAHNTPTFFVNGYRVMGARPLFRFKMAVDAALAGKEVPSPDDQHDGKSPIKVWIGANPSAFGKSDAKVQIVKFSDFECSFCANSSKTVERLKQEYKDKIYLVFKHFPLSFHKKAHLAAQASLAAHAQGKFWEYHYKLFANTQKLDKKDLLSYAQDLGLDVHRFHADLDSGKYRMQVESDIDQARWLGAEGAPTFVINGRRLTGALPYNQLKDIIDALLADKPFPEPQKRK
jgi:protein-disulfide isomerase